MDHIGWRADNRLQLFALILVDIRNRSNQAHGIRMQRIFKDIINICFFHNQPTVHHQHAAAELCHNTEIMGNKHDAHAHFLLYAAHQLENLILNRDVQCGCRLICNQQVRFAGKCHCYHDTLTHPAGKLMGKAFKPCLRFRNSNHPEQINYPFLSLCLGKRFVMRPEHLSHLLSHRDQRIEACHWVLENHGNFFAADAAHFLRRKTHKLSPVQLHATAYDFSCPYKKLHYGEARYRFSASAFSHNANRFPFIDEKGDSAHCLYVTR